MDLKLYEQIMLLALRDDKGTVTGSFSELALAGSVIAELILNKRIAVDASKKKNVTLLSAKPVGDELLDLVLEKIKAKAKPDSLSNWVNRVARFKSLRVNVALQLVDKGILKEEQEKILLIFKRQVFPELNPIPEQQVISRIESAIAGKDKNVSPDTLVLISLAHNTGLLKSNLDPTFLKNNKVRIEQIIKGEAIGKVAQEVIVACQTAIFVAAIMPAMMTTVIATG